MQRMPSPRHVTCLSDSLQRDGTIHTINDDGELASRSRLAYTPFVSFIRSGTTVTSAIYRKPPAVNGRIHAVASPAEATTQTSNTFQYGMCLCCFTTCTFCRGGRQRKERTEESASRGDELRLGGLPAVEARVDEQREVAHLVWDFVQQHRTRRQHAHLQQRRTSTRTNKQSLEE